MTARDYSVIVIGSGFGGTMTALSIARQFQVWNSNHSDKPRRVLMLERGTWWTTSVSTVQDPEVDTYSFLAWEKRQPVQAWPTQNHFRGVLDLVSRCRRHAKNLDGLYDFMSPGRSLFGLFRLANDGVNILRASGVGGGSLVYSNITIQPPDLIFDDPRWEPSAWSRAERARYYDLARDAIGRGVLFALDQEAPPPPSITARGPINTGLSRIATRTAGLNPHWRIGNGTPRLDPHRADTSENGTQHPVTPGDDGLDRENHLWLDRARVFQTAVSDLADDYGSVQLAINDFISLNPTQLSVPTPPSKGRVAVAAADNQYDDPQKGGKAKNYCERQGRCNVGCLPGARHTLNKQLMAAVHGRPDGTKPAFEKELEIWPLTIVDVVESASGGYTVHYRRQDPEQYLSGESRDFEEGEVTADAVIVAAGCLGTAEILLRSKARGTIPGLSNRVGYGFSTNGDYIGFMEKTKQRSSLMRGPVTTSFAHFNVTNSRSTTQSGAAARQVPGLFHTVEDQGIPPAMASLAGVGLQLTRSLAKGRHPTLFRLWLLLLLFWKLAIRRPLDLLRVFLTDPRRRPELFRSEEELVGNMMCVVAMGQEAAKGEFRLGKAWLGDTELRLHREGEAFHNDPVYQVIRDTFKKLQAKLEDPDEPMEFQNPFMSTGLFGKERASLAVTHPLGGCRIASNASEGVVDKYGRVFDGRSADSRGVHRGLYIADASIIPTALGVNPSLTISALALRIADAIIDEQGWREIQQAL